MSTDVVELSYDNQTLVVTLNRPERRNAVNREVLEALKSALNSTHGQRALVLTGADGNFCSGADLSGVEDEEFVGLLHEVLVAIREAPYPTIAAVDGYALGAGTQLSTACDLRVATSDATFGIPAAKLGLAVDWWTVRRVVAMCGEGTARSMLLAAETISGADALRLGYVQRPGSLAEALAWGDTIASLAPLTIEAHKTMLNRLENELPENSDVAGAWGRAWGSDDLQEGIKAFRERRPPEFTGQ